MACSASGSSGRVTLYGCWYSDLRHPVSHCVARMTPSGLLEAETVSTDDGLTVEMRGSLGTFRSHIRLARRPRPLVRLHDGAPGNG